ncbi:MAG: HAD family phosphatase [Bryobacterales bacterium]|nr:HAD family phosphatase [Bryobacterales bacterium]
MFENLTIAPGIALIFDMDGVIVESMELHNQAWDLYLSRAGIDAKDVMARMLGKRNDQIVKEVWGDGLSDEEVFRHGAEKEQLYRDMMAPVLEAHLVPGVCDFIRAAHARGVPIALATNAEAPNVDFVLGGAGIQPLFQTTVDGGQVTHAKPHPEVFLTAAARLGIAPANCVVFEDSPGGMQAARSAGAHLVGLLTTLMAAPQADLAIPNFHDPKLLPWLSTLQLR